MGDNDQGLAAVQSVDRLHNGCFRIIIPVSYTHLLIVSELEVQDIDNLTDWKIAEMKYRLMTEEK